jgi:hypothetical protein
MGEWSYSSTLLDLGTRWSSVIRFTPRRGGWLGPRTGLDDAKRTRIFCPSGNGSPAVQPVAMSIELYHSEFKVLIGNSEDRSHFEKLL